MSVTTDLEYDLHHATARPIAAIARAWRVDPRIPATVPGFDAPFFQAGLAGYSDGAMRLIARRHGCPFCITEALLDRTLINGGKGRAREHPDVLAQRHTCHAAPTPGADDTLEQEECGTGELDENRPATNMPATENGDTIRDHPIAGQIMGTDPDDMAKGAALLVEMGHDVIDVNLACPVKKIRRRARGGHFLRDPEAAIEVLLAVRMAVPARVPCTVKLRRAFDDTAEMAFNFDRIFDRAYELGYAWAIVHARTVEQKYLGPAKWPFLVDLVKRYPDRLIFGSGDVWTVDDIFAMLETTGVHAASVARGCIGNPWIFRQARQLMAGEAPAPPTLAEQRRVLLEHFNLAAQLHGSESASWKMRKFGIKFSTHHPDPDKVRIEFIRCRTVEEWRRVIDAHYRPHVPATFV